MGANFLKAAIATCWSADGWRRTAETVAQIRARLGRNQLLSEVQSHHAHGPRADRTRLAPERSYGTASTNVGGSAARGWWSSKVGRLGFTSTSYCGRNGRPEAGGSLSRPSTDTRRVPRSSSTSSEVEAPARDVLPNRHRSAREGRQDQPPDLSNRRRWHCSIR